MTKSAKKYVSALYSLSKEDNISDRILSELETIDALLYKFPKYVKLLDSAAISSEEKYKCTDDAFGGKMHVYTVNFVKILAAKRMVHLFHRCLEEYRRMYDGDNNTEKAEIITAFALSDEDKKRVANKISQSYRKVIKPEFKVDEKIIGGMVIKFPDKTVNASIKNRLDGIKRGILVERNE